MVKKVIMVLKIGQNPVPQRNKVITNAIFYLAWYYFKIHDNTSRGEKSHLLLQDLRIASYNVLIGYSDYNLRVLYIVLH